MNKYVFFILFLTGCSYYDDDNFLEEYVENILEDGTKIDIDLTPNSEEPNVRRTYHNESDGTFYLWQRNF